MLAVLLAHREHSTHVTSMSVFLRAGLQAPVFTTRCILCSVYVHMCKYVCSRWGCCAHVQAQRPEEDVRCHVLALFALLPLDKVSVGPRASLVHKQQCSGLTENGPHGEWRY